ncbi:UDENN domain-containing protein [Mycena indigotica]|uniref:UDENN domain-containing protein n=1 Tax=Mycena indigotica TaxID=2126181 RepID=A0A8H6T1Y8_9AGAR|nr:UDENN domain-containing protein [Mycena indigotica]KAF7309518.1 UDENN domain-containing protein [Mycena indigotica]
MSFGSGDDIGDGELNALSPSPSSFATPTGPSPSPSPSPSIAQPSHRNPEGLAQRPQGIVRSRTFHSVPKSRRKNSEIDALVVDPDVLAHMRRWILGVAIVEFDVDEGPVITGIYPPLVIADAENIAFSAFPDSPQFEEGTQSHSFCIRELPLTLPGRESSPAKDGFLYGFAHFTQRKVHSSKRGYEQRSLVILTRHAYPALFTQICTLLGPLFQEHGLPMLEAACHNIAMWSDPTPGLVTELGFLGTVLTVELPLSADQQQLASKSFDPKEYILASSSWFSPPPILLFEAALSHLWSIWECLVLCEPLLVFGTSPAQTSQAIWWLRDLLRPLPLTGDIRPYFTIHDTDHAVMASRLPPTAGRILGVTNPVFERECAHWPHILSLGRQILLNNTSHSASAGNTRAPAGPAPGWKTRNHTRYISKDRVLLKRFEEACNLGSERDRLDASLELRRHFHARSTELLVPLTRYLQTLIPTPAEKASANRNEPLRMRPFSAPAFLSSLKTGSVTLPFRSTARRKEFYERLLRTPTFVFSLNGRSLKLDSRADIEPYISQVDPSQIEEIHFGGNTIGVDASLALAEFLQKANNLKVADFADIFTGRLITEIPQALKAICDALKDKTSLVEINLSDNAFGGRSVEPMVPFLIENRSFQVLKLNNNGLGPAGGVVLANALLESAKLSQAEGNKSNLHTVICGRNRLEDGSAPAWAEAFAAHGTLQHIRMPQNGIRMDGIAALAKGLSKCPDMREIDLQDNAFIADGELAGVQAWTEALKQWPELRVLNLSDCVLSSDGDVPTIITALAGGSNPKLHTLQIQNNNLESESFEALSGGIDKMPELKLVEVQWNEVDDDNEHLQTIAAYLKRRGGKIVINDEDDEEEVEAEGSADKSDDLDELTEKLGKVDIQ